MIGPAYWILSSSNSRCIAILNFFSRHGQHFHSTKDQPRTRPTSIFFCKFAVILDKFSAPTSSNFFLWKIWVITNSKSAPNITWWVYWMRNRGLLLPIFCTFFYPVTLLTHSAMNLWRTFLFPLLQNWQNLRISLLFWEQKKIPLVFAKICCILLFWKISQMFLLEIFPRTIYIRLVWAGNSLRSVVEKSRI